MAYLWTLAGPWWKRLSLLVTVGPVPVPACLALMAPMKQRHRAVIGCSVVLGVVVLLRPVGGAQQ